MSGNNKLIEIFEVQDEKFLIKKVFDQNPNQTWPAYSHDVPVYWISNQKSMHDWDNERKPWIYRNFLSGRGITLIKIIWPEPNSNLTCVFSWWTYIPNFNSKCQCMNEIQILLTWHQNIVPHPPFIQTMKVFYVLF